MSRPFSVALPTQLQRRGEIVGLTCGALCFPFAFFGGTLGHLFPRGPAGVILPIVLFSTVAGVVACMQGTRSDAEEMAIHAPRVGVRAGLVATLMGGAFTVLAASLHSMGIGQPNLETLGFSLSAVVLPASRALQILVIALMGVPPSVFFGMAGALITAMIRTQPTSGGEPIGSQLKVPTTRSRLFIWVLLFSAFGYLSPFLVVLKPRPKPLPAPIVTIAKPAPEPPKWRYRKPADFDSADADRLVVSDRRTLDNISADKPVAMSPDGLRFAYCRSGGKNLAVVDLETLDVVASAYLSPVAIAWSADSKRLLIVTDDPGEDRTLHVLDATGRVLDLPQPVEARVPRGYATWWSDEEVFFVEESGRMQLLNLDTLRVHPGEESPKWLALSKPEQEAVRRGQPSHLARNSRWQMRVDSVVRKYYVPLKVSYDWTTSEQLELCFEQIDKPERFFQFGVDFNSRDRLVSSTDGTKLVRIPGENANGEATVFYFGTRPQPGTTFQVAMPSAFDSSIAEAVAKKNVSAFVCAPLINPLNGKTIGPDRKHVKAIARIMSWKDSQAEFWADANYLPIEAGDVVADLHTWSDHIPKAAGELGLKEWFAIIDKPDTTLAIPLTAEAPNLDKVLNVTYEQEDGSNLLRSSAWLVKNKPQPASANSETASNPFTQFASPDPNVSQTLSDFVKQHHLKSSRGDVDGLVNDYADQVDHFDHGMVNRDYIRKDETDYHAPGVQLSESVVGSPIIRKISDTRYQVAYAIGYMRVRPDRHWVRGFADITLQIELFQEGPRIVYQRAVQRDQQKGP